MMRLWFGCLLTLVLTATAGAATDTSASTDQMDKGCRLNRVATAAMTIEKGGVPSVPLSAGDHTVDLIVDTASGASMLSMTAVNTFHLKAWETYGPTIRYSTGRMTFLGMMDAMMKNMSHAYTIVPGAVLGGWKPIDISFFVVPGDVMKPPYDGVFAADLLSKFDIEFDFSNSTLNLFSPVHCPDRVVYWTKDPAAKIPFELNEYHEIEIPIELDGRAMKAIVSTGSPRTFASFERLESDFDIGVGSAGLKASPSFDGKGDTYEYPFKTLSFEGVTIRNPNIVLVPSLTQSISHGPDVIVIGADLLQRFHFYIDYRAKAIYLTSATAR